MWFKKAHLWFKKAHPCLRFVLLLLLSLVILSLLICIGVKFGLILPLYQLLPELKYYTQGYRGFLWEWIGYALFWDLLVTNLIDAATRNPVACLLLGVFIHVNYKTKIDTTLWFHLRHKWIQSLYILVVFFIQQRRTKTETDRDDTPGEPRRVIPVRFRVFWQQLNKKTGNGAGWHSWGAQACHPSPFPVFWPKSKKVAWARKTSQMATFTKRIQQRN